MFFKLRYLRDYIAASGIKSFFLWIIKIVVVAIVGFLVAIALGKATFMQDGSPVKVKVCDNGDIMFVTDMTQKSEELGVIRVEWP